MKYLFSRVFAIFSRDMKADTLASYGACRTDYKHSFHPSVVGTIISGIEYARKIFVKIFDNSSMLHDGLFELVIHIGNPVRENLV